MKNELEPTFKIVFFGVVHSNQTITAVMERFRLLFNIQKESTLKHLFSGNMVVLKRGLSHEEANKYQEVIYDAGADCSVEPESAIGQFGGTDINYERKKKRVLSSIASKGLSNIELEPR